MAGDAVVAVAGGWVGKTGSVPVGKTEVVVGVGSEEPAPPHPAMANKETSRIEKTTLRA
jgi:hypothetical protein